ncbi:hypothetical protein C6P45_003706 [Maudiozyma exigua]|uniref:Uncharacterized protein n=1 Tax=Maudiozyma exigua TaxID=34358 RepID=A0A9P7BBJ9_MAUEX|nr:hypothetical protein C6P45_003706 [Kazachstania exigua]
MAPNNSNLNDSWVRIPRNFNTGDTPIVQILELNSETELEQVTDNAQETNLHLGISRLLSRGTTSPLTEEQKQEKNLEIKKDNYFVHFIIHTFATVWGIQLGQYICSITMDSQVASPTEENITAIATNRGIIIIIILILQLTVLFFGLDLPTKDDISKCTPHPSLHRKLISVYLGYYLQSKKFNNLCMEIFSKGICALSYGLNTIEILCLLLGNFTEQQQLKLFGLFKALLLITTCIPIILCYFNIPYSNSMFSLFGMDTTNLETLLSFPKYPMAVFIFNILVNTIKFKSIYEAASNYWTTNLILGLSLHNVSSSVRIIFASMRWSNIKQYFQTLIKPPSTTTIQPRKKNLIKIQFRSLVISYMIALFEVSMMTMNPKHNWIYNCDFIFRVCFVTLFQIFPSLENDVKQYACGSGQIINHWFKLLSALNAGLIHGSYLNISRNFLTFPYSGDLITFFETFGYQKFFKYLSSEEDIFSDIFSRINWAFLILLIWASMFGGTQAQDIFEWLHLIPLSTFTFYSMHRSSGDIETWD